LKRCEGTSFNAKLLYLKERRGHAKGKTEKEERLRMGNFARSIQGG